MFTIHKGSTRITLILFKKIVVKFPNCIDGAESGGPLYCLRECWKQHEFNTICDEGFIGKWLRGIFQDFLVGISGNISEGWLWRETRSCFLQPTFSLICFNLQQYAGERIPTFEELKPFFEALSKKGKDQLKQINPHEFQDKNWRIVNGQLRLIDYGGKIYHWTSFVYFLWRHRNELERSLANPVA